jgi:hypothetical protein
MTTLLARLKPYNPRRGHVLRSYTILGVRFKVERGWYEIDATLAARLRTIRQRSNDADSPDAFDVMTKEEAVALEQREQEIEDKRAAPNKPTRVRAARAAPKAADDDAGALTTRDLPGSDDAEDGGGDFDAEFDKAETADITPAPFKSRSKKKTSKRRGSK